MNTPRKCLNRQVAISSVFLDRRSDGPMAAIHYVQPDHAGGSTCLGGQPSRCPLSSVLMKKALHDLPDFEL